jgi:hypothetical protein
MYTHAHREKGATTSLPPALVFRINEVTSARPIKHNLFFPLKKITANVPSTGKST